MWSTFCHIKTGNTRNGNLIEKIFFGHVVIVTGLKITISIMRELLTAVNKTLRSTCLSIL